MTRRLGFVLATVAFAACNQQTINTPLRSFDRPSDVALTCVQYDPRVFMETKDVRPQGVYYVRPLADCEPVTASENALTPGYTLPLTFIPTLGPGNFTPFLVALVPQSARGELAFVDTAQGKLVDLDPYTPGYGFLPVGKLPEHVRTSKDGCMGVTANTDSCNLARVDISQALHSAVVSIYPQDLASGNSAIAASGVTTLPLSVPSAGGGPPKILYARPSWIEMAPENDSGGKPSIHSYQNSDGTPATNSGLGFCSGGDHRAWVALPACQLVVKVHLENDGTTTPTIEKAIHVTQSGVSEVTDLTTIDCPVECAGVPGSGGVSDGGVPAPTDMGTPGPTQAFPTAIAVDAEADVSGLALGGRLVIGDAQSERVDIVPFDVVSGKIGTASSVQLDPGDNGLQQPGVKVVRVGPRSQAGKFLYAIAQDGTVRVIDLDRNAECETNPDPRYQDANINLQQTPTRTDISSPWTWNMPPARSLACFPVGAPGTPHRSVFASSPGITLAPGQLPTDVAFVHVDSPPGDPTMATAPPPAAPGLLVGDFAWIITSDGKGTVINIYDACLQPNQQAAMATSGNYTASCIPGNIQQSLSDTVSQFGHPQPFLFEQLAHQIREGHPRFFNPPTESDITGQPRVPDNTNPCGVAVPPTSPGLPDGGVPDAGGCGQTSSNLPSLYRELVPAPLNPAPGETRVVYFVDPSHVRNETWELAWEGTLPGSDRSVGAPLVIPATSTAPRRAFLADSGGAWCSRGVLAGDKLIFKGCSGDTECDQAAGFQCVHDPGAFPDQSQGMCLHIGPKPDGTVDTVDTWTGACGLLLRSQRKFRILSAKQGAQVPMGSTTGTPSTPPGGATTDLLELGEIYEPEFTEEFADKTCNTDDDCKMLTVTVQPDNQPRKTSCLQDADGQKRCLLSCVSQPDNNCMPGCDPGFVCVNAMCVPKTITECGFDFECAPSAFGDPRCMRAPIGSTDVVSFWQQCMPELQEYEIHVGASFAVSGTTSGYLSNEVQGPGGECIVPPQTLDRVRLTQWRVPLSGLDDCPDNVNANPLSASIDPTVLPRNVCTIKPAQPGSTLIHFENPIFNIVVQIPTGGPMSSSPLIPPDGTSISMGVTGGGSFLQALLGVDVQAQQPRYVTVAPDHQTLYVVDEGKSPVATGLRGQLLRLFSNSQAVDTTFVVR
jgi:hypothetical protein